MPTYEYACEACGHKFEEFQSITAKPVKKCPVCKKNKVKRLISAGAGFIFKGSGFYITDYRSDNYKAGEKSAAAPSAPAEGAKSDAPGKTETKSDAVPKAEPAKAEAKPAAKAESKPAPTKSSSSAKKK